MIAAEPPTTAADTATDRTSPRIEAVQPTHGPSFTPSSPYTGPIDQQSIIASVILGQITTREAAVILGTSTDQIRALKSRAIKRAAKPPTAARTPKHSHAENTERDVSPVSPPLSEPFDDAKQHPSARSNGAQIVDNEAQFATNPPDVASETLDAIAQAMHTITDALGTETTLQSLQDGPPETLSEGGETPNEAGSDDQTQTETAPETPSETRRLTGGGTRHPASLANLAKGVEKAKNRQPDDEGSFEREELETLDNLHRIIVRNAKRAESGKDCQGWTTALSTVLDLRRRAAGKDSTLVKSQTPKALSTRNSIVFIGTSQAPSEPAKAKLAKLQPAQVIDIAPSEDQSLNEGPPALKAALAKAPDYVRRL